MVRKPFLSILTLSLLCCLPLDDIWGRGFGGGGYSMGGGGFGGGHSMGGGGLGGGGFGAGGHSMGGGGLGGGGFGAGGHSMGGGGLGGGGFGAGGHSMGGGGFGGGGGHSQQSFGGGGLAANRSAMGGNPGAGRVQDGFGEQRVGGANSGERGGQAGNNNRFSSASPSKLDGFLGLPSDGGLSGLSGSRSSSNAQRATGDNFDVNRGTAEGPNGGQAAGVAVTGPGGNTRAAAVGVGADGGVARVGGVQGANGGQAVRGVAVGPNGGVAAGYARVSPAGRYTSAVAVRGNYNHWGMYGPGWYTNHPGAWFAAGMTANAIWQTATWNSVGAWMSYPATQPTYYDYGNNVAYQDGSVYVNGEDAGTSQQYYDQASQIAQVGAQAEPSDASQEGQWLPLGVFALTKTGGSKSDVSIQLAVNKQGIIRGNYTDTETGKTQLVQGSVDKQTQRVAFSVGDDKSNLIETGLYNLTKDEAPALVHVGKDKTEQWLLVRLNKPNEADASSSSAT